MIETYYLSEGKQFNLQTREDLAIFITIMGQALCIHFDRIDYTFQILNNRPLSAEIQEIQILLNGTTQTLSSARANG